jgi:hypothetical protein
VISGPIFIEQLISRFRESGFVPYSDSQSDSKKRQELTLHQGIRGVLNMRDDDSIFMYWEWRQLKTAFDSMWTELDLAASKLDGRITTAIAMCSRPASTTNDLMSLLSAVEPEKLVDFPIPVRRPTKSEAQVRFIGKRLGAILMTLGVVVEATNTGFGDLFSSISFAVDDDIQLLDHLDGLVHREIGNPHEATPPSQVVVLRALGRAYEKVNQTRVSEELSEISFAQFLRETELTANWSGLTDQNVLRRLLVMAPEDIADSSRRAIEKFLD